MLGSAQAELILLRGHSKVPREIQATLASLGFSDMDVFAQIGDTAGEVRDMVAKDLGLCEDLSIQAKALAARALAAWEAAQGRGQKRKAEGAEVRAVDLPALRPR